MTLEPVALPPVRRTRREALFDTLKEDATAILQSVVNEVAPTVVNAIDVGEVVDRVDIQHVIDRVDLNEVMAKVDVEALIDRVDLNEVLAKVDVDHLVDRVDIVRVLIRLDPVVLAAIVNGVVSQMDLNPVIDKLDLNAIMAKIDIDALLERVDVNRLMERTELGPIIASATSGVTGEAVDAVRSAGVGLDSFVHRWADRIFRRPLDQALGPPLLVAPKEQSSS